MIKLGQDVKEEIGVAGNNDDYREFMIGIGEFKRAAGQLDYVAKRRDAVVAVTFGIDDLAFVKGNARQMQVRFYDHQPGHFSVFDHLDGIENTYVPEISGERYISPNLLRSFVASGGKFGPARTANGFEAGSYRDPRIEQLRLLQTVIREVEIFAADIKAYEGQTLAGGFVQILLLYADVAHLFAKWNRPRATLERLAQERKRLVRRTVFNEQIGIEKDGFKGYLGKRDRGLRSSNLFHMRSGGMNKNVQHL